MLLSSSYPMVFLPVVRLHLLIRNLKEDTVLLQTYMYQVMCKCAVGVGEHVQFDYVF